MDGAISIPRNIQPDRIAPAVAKRDGHSGNPRRFEEQLSREKKSSDDPDHKPDLEDPAEAGDAGPQPESSAAPAEPAEPAETPDGGLLDYQA